MQGQRMTAKAASNRKALQGEITKFVDVRSGRNDPDYYRRLENTARIVDGVAKEASTVRIVEDPRDPRIEVRLHSRSKPALRWAGQAMARIFQAKCFAWKPPAPDDAADSYAQPPAHTHYKDDQRQPLKVEKKRKPISIAKGAITRKG